MLRSLNEFKCFSLFALDGNIGRCINFLIEESRWTVRYIVAESGDWLPGRKVLISPVCLGKTDWEEKKFPLRLTMDQIKNAPYLDEQAPVSRQYEVNYFKHYGWPCYWAGPDTWGTEPSPFLLYLRQNEARPDTQGEGGECSPLHDASSISGSHILGADGEIGLADDFIMDDKS